MKKRLLALNLALLLLLALLPSQIIAADMVLTAEQPLQYAVTQRGDWEVTFTPAITGSYTFRIDWKPSTTTGNSYDSLSTPGEIKLYGADNTKKQLSEIDNRSHEYYLQAGHTYHYTYANVQTGYTYRLLAHCVTQERVLLYDTLTAIHRTTSRRSHFRFTAPEEGLYAVTCPRFVRIVVLSDTEAVRDTGGMMLLQLKAGESCALRLDDCNIPIEETGFDNGQVIVQKINVQPYVVGSKQTLTYPQALTFQMPEDGDYTVGIKRTPSQMPTWEYEDTYIDGIVLHHVINPNYLEYPPDFYVFNSNLVCVGCNETINYFLDNISVLFFSGQYYIVPYRNVTCKNLQITPTWYAPFEDVSYSNWYYEAVKYAYQHNLFMGTSPSLFSPNATMTRAMLVTVLHRMEGKPSVAGLTNSFSDVAANLWYTDAVTWASNNKVVDGVGNGRFNPEGSVTREQMATILYRYATMKQFDTSARADLSKFTDANQISAFAQTAMQWAVGNGIINGLTPTTLNPKGSATRAQVATVLMNYLAD